LFWRLLKIIIIPLIKNFYKLRIDVQGRDNVPASGAVIILGNQTNFISTLAVESVLRRKVYWAVSPSVCKTKLLRLIFKTFCGCFLLETERADTRGFRSAFKKLRSSKILAFYPGIINRGVTLFCLRSGCNILPMAITQEALHPNHIKITFGSVFNLSEYQHMVINVKNIEDLIQKINQSIKAA